MGKEHPFHASAPSSPPATCLFPPFFNHSQDLWPAPAHLQQDEGIIKKQHALCPQWGDCHGDVLAVLQESASGGAEHILVRRGGNCKAQGPPSLTLHQPLHCPPLPQAPLPTL